MAGELICTYESEKAIVRVFAGKRTAEERKAAFAEASILFDREIQKQKKEVSG